MNVDFQKQTVDPVGVSFNTLHSSQVVSELLLTVDVTEVRLIGVLPLPSLALSRGVRGLVHENSQPCVRLSRLVRAEGTALGKVKCGWSTEGNKQSF